MIKKIFLAAAAIGLVMNLLADMTVWRQNKEVIRTGAWVSRSYDVLQKIDAVKLSVFESKVGVAVAPDLIKDIKVLSAGVVGIESQEALANQLQILNTSALNHGEKVRLLGILTRMAAGERALLAERSHADDEANSLALAKSFFANGIDILLILLFVGFFFYEKKKAQALQRAIAQALIQIEEVNQNLRLSLAARDSQMKTVVHDLKNPLGSIRGFAELLYQDASNKDNVIEMAGIIQRISNSTLSLVGGFLKENSAHQIFEAVNISDCIEYVRTCLRPIAEEKHQKIEVQLHSPDLRTWATAYQLQDLFFNLIGNALKFSPRGATVRIASRTDGDFYKIEIKDEGPGFAKNDFEKLFVAEAKLSAKPTGNETSNGIGLYSAKQTMDRLHGRISVENNAKKGACVSVSFIEVL